MGIFEIAILLLLALVVLGPEQMPGLIRAGLKIVREVRAAANEAMSELSQALDEQPRYDHYTQPAIAQSTAHARTGAPTGPLDGPPFESLEAAEPPPPERK